MPGCFLIARHVRSQILSSRSFVCQFIIIIIIFILFYVCIFVHASHSLILQPLLHDDEMFIIFHLLQSDKLMNEVAS